MERIREIFPIDRHEFENDFLVAAPYLLVSIRKPGTRFVEVPMDSWCVSKCILMFHEHDGFGFNSRGTIVTFDGRMSNKLLSFIALNFAKAPTLVIQSEYKSREREAIRLSLCRWLGVPIEFDHPPVDPDIDTGVALQRSIAAITNDLGTGGWPWEKH